MIENATTRECINIKKRDGGESGRELDTPIRGLIY